MVKEKIQQNQKRLYGVRALTKRFRDSAISAHPTLAAFIPLTDFTNMSFAANVSYIEKEQRTMERKTLQPDVYGEGKDSAGVVTTPYFCAQKAAQPRPRPARGAGLAGRPGRGDG